MWGVGGATIDQVHLDTRGVGRVLVVDPVACKTITEVGDLRPDAVILLDVPVAVGLARAKGRGVLDRFEQEDIAFFERVRGTYRERAQGNPAYHLVDAGQALPQVQAELDKVLVQLKGRWLP